LSSHEKEEDVIKAIRAGANAYCTKDVDQDKLVYIVSTVLKGAAWFDPKVAQYVLNAATNDATVSTQKVELKQDETAQNDFGLTSREKQVLGYLSEGASNQEISKKLNLSVNTIKVHVCNILHKMSVSDRTQAAIKAIKHNII
jgi:DNA-binding NarL/FixJ family response regulator